MRQPPRLTEAVLRRALARLGDAGDSIVGDLREEYGDRCRGYGEGRAARWYRRQALGLVLRAQFDGIRRGGPFHRPAASAARRTRYGGDMRDVGRELSQAGRSLSRVPQYALAAVATLALAVAANTIVFSVVDSVLLEPLPYPESNRLVHLRHTAPGLNFPEISISPGIYHHYRERATGFEESGLWREDVVNLTGEGETPERVRATRATHTLFATLRVSPLLGRIYVAEEDIPDAPPTVLLSHSLWQRRFGGDRSVLGRTLRVDGVEREIVGVMPAGFAFPGAESQIYLPVGLDLPNSAPGAFSYNSLARLRPGATLEQTRVQLNGLVDRLGETFPGEDGIVEALKAAGFASTAESLKDSVVGDLKRPLLILLGTAALVLVIACANVTNLFLVRAESRQREVAVRAALGAGHGTLTRLFLSETLLIAALAAVFGTLVGAAGTAGLMRIAPPSIPRIEEIGLDATVVFYACGLATVVALLLALFPTLRLTSPAVLAQVTRGGRATAGRERHRARQVLVVVQTALALVLLAGSGLMLRTFAQLRSVNPGFDAQDLLTFRISLPAASYPDAISAASLHERLLERLRALPGVQSAGAVSQIPLSSQATGTAFVAEGQTLAENELPPLIFYAYTSEDYFSTMRIPVLSGETFQHANREANRRAIVVSQAAAERYWPGQDPIGRRLRAGTSLDDTTGWNTVIGVVENVRDRGLDQEPGETIYFPMLAGPDGDTIASNTPVASSMAYAIRSSNPLSLAAQVRRAVWDLDPNLPIANATTMQNMIGDSMVRISFTMLALVIAGALALFLGAIGLYGVISYIVAQRAREIGLRLALGADAAQVRRMVVWQGLRLSAIGLATGAVAALALTRLLESQLYDTAPNDPLTFTSATILLAAVGFLASWVPALRASRMDPARTLQVDG